MSRAEGYPSKLFLPLAFPFSFLLMFLPFYNRKYDKKQIIKT
jgi:hypothetical protein